MMDLYKIVEELQNYENEKVLFDRDSSPTAIEYYKTIYHNHSKILDEFDFSKLEITPKSKSDKDYHRLHIQVHKESCFRNQYNKAYFELSGDCDFNFNDKKFKIFAPLLKDYNSIYYEKLIFFLNNRHHALINMSLMLTTGGLNSFKGLNDFDRFDKFLFHLNNYYTENNIHILSKASHNNKDFLKIFLDCFTDIYDYCRNIYFIYDKDLIDEIIESGEIDINFKCDLKQKENVEFLIKYMDLAEKYWREKDKNISTHLISN